MSLPMSIRSARCAANSVRCFATSSAVSADAASTSKRPPVRRQPLRDFNMSNLEDFQFDDATSLGYLRLEKIREAQEIVRRVDADRASLQAQRKPFTPPTAPIRLSQTIDLSEPNSLVHRKRVLQAPVSKLPLRTPEATHRFKLLAGPRWTPGRPGRSESVKEENAESTEGWIKISDERFPDGLMNRKSVTDMLERLTEAANDPNSPLPADTPLDPRPLLARQRKRPYRRMARISSSSATRLESIGNVPGFPKEWLQGDHAGKESST